MTRETVALRCSACQQRLVARSEAAGREFDCPRCGGRVRVPAQRPAGDSWQTAAEQMALAVLAEPLPVGVEPLPVSAADRECVEFQKSLPQVKIGDHLSLPAALLISAPPMPPALPEIPAPVFDRPAVRGPRCPLCAGAMVHRRLATPAAAHRQSQLFLVGLLLAPVCVGLVIILWSLFVGRERRLVCRQCGHHVPSA